ncbi:NifB/NifX family molybdenum-iron cluster-binding protein [Candidatus Bathyarchaeota archaeon]|nr:NifB/NifX family molybdenum-iron cluster-binding protein [Candidatus Bathyarchaeota archaeon]
MVKLVIPIERFEGEMSTVFPHFGRAPHFAVAELTEDGSVKSITSIDNVGDHFGGHGAAEALVSKLEPDALVVKGMGPRGLEAFQSRGVAVYTGDVNTIGEAITAYTTGRLVALTEACREARHHPECR